MMKRRARVGAMAAVMTSTGLGWAEPAEEPAFEFYGHARLDAAYATGRMAHPYFGLWALPPDADGHYEPEFTLHPRWSRFGMDWDAGDLGDRRVRVRAKLELDFHDNLTLAAGRSESRQLPRMRHAYGQVQMGDVTVLAGQTWDLIAPLIAGGMEQAIFWYGGNLGDRRPQARVTYAPEVGPATLVLAAAAAQSGAVDMQDLDADGAMDGNASARPALQGLAELRWPALDERPIRLGVSGHWGAKGVRVGGEVKNFEVVGLNGHLELPISVATLRAEVWTGRNMSDLRGGIAQGIRLVDVDGDGAFEEGSVIRARGGWAHLSVSPVSWYTVTVGAGIDNPKDVAAGGRSRNTTFDFSLVLSPWQPVKLGLVSNLYRTEYRAGDDAQVHRLMGYTMVSF